MNLKLLCIICCIYSLCSQAIVIRHDTDDRLYRDLANKYKHSIAYLDYCVATLIDTKWLITASHCVNPEMPAPLHITFLDEKYAVEEIIVHPDAKDSEVLDMALLKLRWELKSAVPVNLYDKNDELDQSVVFIGKGKFGNGVTGELMLDNIVRAATNTVNAVEDNWLSFNFNEPDTATLLEGVSGTQDSGGPALIEYNKKIYIAGIGCCQQPVITKDGIELQGGYNSTEYYSRVSPYVQWIRAQLANNISKKPLSHPILTALADDKINQATSLLLNTPSWINQPELVEEILLITLYKKQLQLAKTLYEAYPTLLNFTIQGLPLTAYTFKQGNGDYFKLLINTGADLSFKGFMDQNYLSLLTWQYANSDYPELLTLLLDKGFNINEQDKRGDAAIHMAGFFGDGDRLKLLVERGADINLADNKGKTVLMDMVNKGNIKLVKLLLSLDADINLQDKMGKTAFMIAKDNKHSTLMALLNSRGAKK